MKTISLLIICALSACAIQSRQPFFVVRFEGQYGHITGGITFFTSDGGKTWTTNRELGIATFDDYPGTGPRDNFQIAPDGRLMLAWRNTLNSYRFDEQAYQFDLPEVPEGITHLRLLSFSRVAGVAVADDRTLFRVRRLNSYDTWHMVKHPLTVIRALVHVGNTLCVSDNFDLHCLAETGAWTTGVSFGRRATSIRVDDEAIWVGGYDGHCQEFKIDGDGVPKSGRGYALDDYEVTDTAANEGTVIVLNRMNQVIALERTTGKEISRWSPSETIISIELGPDGTAYAVGGSSDSFGFFSSAVAYRSDNLIDWESMSFK